MNFKFWQRTPVKPAHDFSESDAALASARHKITVANRQLEQATQIAKASRRTLEINHFSAMMESAWADAATKGRNP